MNVFGVFLWKLTVIFDLSLFRIPPDPVLGSMRVSLFIGVLSFVCVCVTVRKCWQIFRQGCMTTTVVTRGIMDAWRGN